MELVLAVDKNTAISIQPSLLRVAFGVVENNITKTCVRIFKSDVRKIFKILATKKRVDVNGVSIEQIQENNHEYCIVKIGSEPPLKVSKPDFSLVLAKY